MSLFPRLCSIASIKCVRAFPSIGYLLTLASLSSPGGTHFMEVWTVWHATYWLSGTVKLVTALASFTTDVVLPPLVPKAMTLLENARLSEQRKQQLEQAHEELRRLYAKSRELDQVKT